MSLACLPLTVFTEGLAGTMINPVIKFPDRAYKDFSSINTIPNDKFKAKFVRVFEKIEMLMK